MAGVVAGCHVLPWGSRSIARKMLSPTSAAIGNLPWAATRSFSLRRDLVRSSIGKVLSQSQALRGRGSLPGGAGAAASGSGTLGAARRPARRAALPRRCGGRATTRVIERVDRPAQVHPRGRHAQVGVRDDHAQQHEAVGFLHQARHRGVAGRAEIGSGQRRVRGARSKPRPMKLRHHRNAERVRECGDCPSSPKRRTSTPTMSTGGARPQAREDFVGASRDGFRIARRQSPPHSTRAHGARRGRAETRCRPAVTSVGRCSARAISPGCARDRRAAPGHR